MDAMEISGYLLACEAEALQQAVADVLARGVAGDVVEVGSYQGRSTVTLALALRDHGAAGRRLLAIDPHEGVFNAVDGLSMVSVEPSLDALLGNLRRFGVADLVRVHVGTVDDAPLPAAIALGFVDGLHDGGHARHDALALLPRMAPGGLLVFHDYGPTWPGVVQTVDELTTAGRLQWVELAGSAAVMQVAEV